MRAPQTNGFVERFQRTVLEEFFVETLRTTFYKTCSSKKPYPGGVSLTSSSSIVVVEHTSESIAPFDCAADRPFRRWIRNLLPNALMRSRYVEELLILMQYILQMRRIQDN